MILSVPHSHYCWVGGPPPKVFGPSKKPGKVECHPSYNKDCNEDLEGEAY